MKLLRFEYKFVSKFIVTFYRAKRFSTSWNSVKETYHRPCQDGVLPASLGFAIACPCLFGSNPLMKPISGYFVVQPEDLSWRPSNMMKIPNADFLERTKSEMLSARLWRLPPKSANTLHRHPEQEEFYFVIEGTGRMKIGGETITIRKHGGVLVGPETLRQVFNDTDEEVLWLIVGAPEETVNPSDPSIRPLYYPQDPKQVPPELRGVTWPPE